MLTLQQLRTPVTKEEARAWAVTELADLGFNAKSWQEGAWQLVLLHLFTDTYANLSNNIATLANAGFNSTADGDALTEFSDSHYDNQRTLATRAVHSLEVTNSAATGPYSPTAGAFIARDTVTGLLYRNISNFSIDVGATETIQVRCDTPGTQGNVAIGTITDLVTTFAGITVTNPDVGDGTSLVTAAVDAEGDAALRARNRSKWGSLTWATPAAGYEYFARQGSANAVRVKVDDGNPRGPGTVDVYIATGSGVATSTDVSDVQSKLDERHSGTPDPLAKAAAAQAQNFTANIYVTAAHFSGGTITAEKKTEIETALRDYVNGLAIGGAITPPPDGDGTTGYLDFSEWVGAVTAVAGVKKVGSPSPAADVAIGAYDVLTVGTITFAYVSA